MHQYLHYLIAGVVLGIGIAINVVVTLVLLFIWQEFKRLIWRMRHK